MPLYSDFATHLYTVSTLPEVKFWVELGFKMTLTTANITVAGKGLVFLEWVVVWWLVFVSLFWDVHVFFCFVFKLNCTVVWFCALSFGFCHTTGTWCAIGWPHIHWMEVEERFQQPTLLWQQNGRKIHISSLLDIVYCTWSMICLNSPSFPPEFFHV